MRFFARVVPLLAFLAIGLAHQAPAKAPAGVSTSPIRLMAVGDSITAGADFFANYRFALWEKLFAAGYVVEFVGTQTSSTRVGPLAHEGYGGRNTEYLAQTVPAHFRSHPADVVLLHSGHNHSAEERPVPGIIAATEKLIAAFRSANPRVIVLLGQVIPAGKLPKYAYLPELNAELAKLAARLDSPQQRVVLVDHATHFDWATDTVADKVHPNARGAEKMAAAWFAALKGILPSPAREFAPHRVAYKQIEESAFELHIFEPPSGERAPSSRNLRPAILFFFGGGWTHGSPLQWYPECAYFADRGFVAISADYRIASTHGATPFDAVADARDAFTWLQQHASALNIDPARIVVAGASAGGHLAALTALHNNAIHQGSPSTSHPSPAALLMWYPILDTSANGYGHALIGERFAEISPVHRLASASKALPPTLIFVGSDDNLAPERIARTFQTYAHAANRVCDVITFPGGGHPLYAYRRGESPLRTETLEAAERFLSRLRVFHDATH